MMFRIRRFSGNDPMGFLDEEGEVGGDEEPRPKR
jgi:hypothetical protein